MGRTPQRPWRQLWCNGMRKRQVEGELSLALSNLAVVTHRGTQTAVQVAKAATDMLEDEDTMINAAQFLRAYAPHVVASLGGAAPQHGAPSAPSTPAAPSTPGQTPTAGRPAPPGVLETIKEGVDMFSSKDGLPGGVIDMVQGILTVCNAA